MHNLPKISAYNKPGENSFLKKSGNDWVAETCRDRLQSHFDSYPEQMEFYFAAGGPKIAQRVIKFMQVVEPAARVNEEDRIKIEATTDESILYVLMSPWWRNPVRRSLLTALLRAGRSYTEESGKGFDAALNSIEYTSKTRKAIDLFLSGHTAVKNKTVPKNGFGGWYNLFGQANFDPSRILTRVKRIKKKPEEEVPVAEVVAVEETKTKKKKTKEKPTA